MDERLPPYSLLFTPHARQSPAFDDQAHLERGIFGRVAVRATALSLDEEFTRQIECTVAGVFQKPDVPAGLGQRFQASLWVQFLACSGIGQGQAEHPVIEPIEWHEPAGGPV